MDRLVGRIHGWPANSLSRRSVSPSSLTSFTDAGPRRAGQGLRVRATLGITTSAWRDGLDDLMGELVEVNGPLDADAVARYVDEWR